MKPPRIYQLPTVTQQIKSSIAAVTVPFGGWTVYGYCRDQNLQPIASYSVFFVNNQKVWIEGYGYAITSAGSQDQNSYGNSHRIENFHY